MVKQFAPMANTPPSPKNSAWMASAEATPMMAADGPSSTASSAAPTGWTVVPPGAGKLNIMMAKQNAAPMESRGTWRVESVLRRFRPAVSHTGRMAPKAAIEVDGPIAESGICMAGRSVSCYPRDTIVRIVAHARPPINVGMRRTYRSRDRPSRPISIATLCSQCLARLGPEPLHNVRMDRHAVVGLLFTQVVNVHVGHDEPVRDLADEDRVFLRYRLGHLLHAVRLNHHLAEQRILRVLGRAKVAHYRLTRG